MESLTLKGVGWYRVGPFVSSISAELTAALRASTPITHTTVCNFECQSMLSTQELAALHPPEAGVVPAIRVEGRDSCIHGYTYTPRKSRASESWPLQC